MSVNLGHWDGSSFIFLISRIAAHLQKHASPGKVQSTSNCRRSIASSVSDRIYIYIFIEFIFRLWDNLMSHLIKDAHIFIGAIVNIELHLHP